MPRVVTGCVRLLDPGRASLLHVLPLPGDDVRDHLAHPEVSLLEDVSLAGFLSALLDCAEDSIGPHLVVGSRWMKVALVRFLWNRILHRRAAVLDQLAEPLRPSSHD